MPNLNDHDLLRSFHRSQERHFTGAMFSSVNTMLSGLLTMDASLTVMGLPSLIPFPTAGEQLLHGVRVILAGAVTGSPVSVDLVVQQGLGGGGSLAIFRDELDLMLNAGGVPSAAYVVFEPPRKLLRFTDGDQQIHATCALNTGSCAAVGVILEWSEPLANTYPLLPWQS